MKINSKIFLPLGLVALLAAGCSSGSNNTTTDSTTTEQTPVAQATPTPPTSQKFTDQDYYSYSYLISGDTLSVDAKQALDGFKMVKTTATKTQPMQITLTATKTGYRDQQYTLQPGQQLYFVEKFLKDDDDEANEDKDLRDDSAIVVDAQGNVVGQPGKFMPMTTP